MKVTGFSFIRNAVKCDYPIVEAIRSILPVCDEFVIAVGKGEDNTLQMVKDIHPTKMRVLETVWDDNMREGGRTFAIETDKAFQAIDTETDWCFYIQADEVVHENTLDRVHESMKQWKDDKRVEGLLLDFIHFHGSYNYVATGGNWHKREVRVVRNDKSIFSYRDSMGFRKRPNEKLHVKNSGGLIHHYTAVKPPELMMNKARAMHSLWHDDEWVKNKLGDAKEFDYSTVDSLAKFEGTHPMVMHDRIARQNWDFEFDTSINRMKLKYRFRRWMEKNLGISIGAYRNYKLI